jgi:hypothetical protein
MAIYTYGSSNIAFNTFQTWANNVNGSTNITLSDATSDFAPANSAPFSVSEFAPNTVIFYGSLSAGTGGQVSVTAPYTSGTASSITVKNVLLSSYSVSITAVQTYPYVFHSWRTAASGGGTQLSTSATLTISTASSSTIKDTGTYYAYFV